MSCKRYLLDIPTTFPGARMKKPNLMAAMMLDAGSYPPVGPGIAFALEESQGLQLQAFSALQE